MPQKYIKVTVRICMKQMNVGKNTNLWRCENITNENSEMENDNGHSVQKSFFSHWVCVSLTANVTLKRTVNVCVYMLKYPLSFSPFFTHLPVLSLFLSLSLSFSLSSNARRLNVHCMLFQNKTLWKKKNSTFLSCHWKLKIKKSAASKMLLRG